MPSPTEDRTSSDIFKFSSASNADVTQDASENIRFYGGLKTNQQVKRYAQYSSDVEEIVNEKKKFLDTEGKAVPPNDLRELKDRLQTLLDGLSKDEKKLLLKDKYVRENINLVLEVDQKTLKLALSTSQQVDRLAASMGLEKQFIPALKLAAYTVSELLYTNGLHLFTADIARDYLSRLVESGSFSWGRGALLRHAIDALGEVDPNASGNEMCSLLTEVLCKKIHTRLANATKERSKLQQSQGVEVEVLSRVLRSKRAAQRGIDTDKWLPRGIQFARLARTDWRVLPLLGIKEDIGERAHQRYEMSTEPTESASSQSTQIFELMAAGFITEDELSDRNEGYSLHVSSVFPKSIMNKASIGEYRGMARALAGAFASDQRINFGGFISGGAEIEDKTNAGTLQEIGKQKDKHGTGLSKDLALVEIRNLDINPKGQYSALLNKECLDFAFRCAWSAKLGVSQSKLEKAGADIWLRFQSRLEAINTANGLSQSQLEPRLTKEMGAYLHELSLTDDEQYWLDKDKSWDEMLAWKAMALAREQNPKLRNDYAKLFRYAAGEVRKALKESANEIEKIKHDVVVVEPLSREQLTIYVPLAIRDTLGVKSGETLTVVFSGKETKVKVAQAWIRSNGKVDDVDNKLWRFSPDTFQALGIPCNLEVKHSYDPTNKVLTFETAKQPLEESNEQVRFSVPKVLHSVSRGAANTVYLSRESMKRMGVQVGKAIAVGYGAASVEAVVALEDFSSSLGLDRSGWNISENLVQAMSLPGGAIRARYDSKSGILSFGPLIAITREVQDAGQGVTFPDANALIRQYKGQADLRGVPFVVIDPRQISADTLGKGMVKGYAFENGKWTQRLLPIPDVVIDNDARPTQKAAGKFYGMVENHVQPANVRDTTKDKLEFARIMNKPEMRQLTPITQEMTTGSSLELFIEEHRQVILKPRYGQRSRGIVRVDYDSLTHGYRVQTKGKTDAGASYRIDKVVSNINELLSLISPIMKGEAYIMQNRINLGNFTWMDEGRKISRSPEIRVIVQRGVRGDACVLGMVARMTDPGIAGEEYLKDPKKVCATIFGKAQSDQLLADMERISLRTHGLCEENVGKKIGVLAVDIAITMDGKPVIIEVNSQPEIRNMLDVIGDKDAAYNSTGNQLDFALDIMKMT